MRFGTSFFNGAVLKKDITRFAPAWSLYAVGMALVLLPALYQNAGSVYSLGNHLIYSAAVNCLYALVCALLLFGDLFNPRLCYALHAMPMRREGWFATHTAAGMLFSLVPNLLLAVLCMPALGQYAWAGLIWLLGMQMQYLFFFALALFCVMCSGNRLAMALVYGILNFLALILYFFATILYLPELYGIRISWKPFFLFSPVLHLMAGSFRPFSFLRDTTRDGAFVSGGWLYMVVLAGIGLVLLGASLVLYRRRKLESAGDFLAFRPVAPVFRIVYTLCVGMLFRGFLDLFFGSGTLSTLFLVMGILVGYFTAQMLLSRTVKVFRLRNLAGCAVILCVLALSVWITRLDPLNITGYVPEPEEVEQVTFSGEYAGVDCREAYTTADPADIACLTEIHSAYLAGPNKAVFSPFSIRYTLRGGRTVTRYYHYAPDTETAGLVAGYLSRPEYVLGYVDWEYYVNSVGLITDSDLELRLSAPEQIRGLLEAVKADCLAGRITRPWDYHSRGEATDSDKNYAVTWLDLSFLRDPGGDQDTSETILICRDCTETIAWLTENGYPLPEE